MKTLIRTLFHVLAFILVTSTVTKAQFVTIPDPNFVGWLNANGFVLCLSGNQLDTTCAAVVAASAVTCSNSNIADLTGIEFFDNLEILNCGTNQLTFLPALPATLLTLDCSFNQLTSLPPLPPLLVDLFCGVNYLNTLPQLPPSVYNLWCG